MKLFRLLTMIVIFRSRDVDQSTSPIRTQNALNSIPSGDQGKPVSTNDQRSHSPVHRYPSRRQKRWMFQVQLGWIFQVNPLGFCFGQISHMTIVGFRNMSERCVETPTEDALHLESNEELERHLHPENSDGSTFNKQTPSKSQRGR